ncbi:hypothetical protein GCM10020255_018830 [Rhodococcus baikonurensis]
MNPHYSLGVDHKIITGILADAGDTLTQKAISSSNASDSWRASILDIFADLYERANAANRELLVYISDRHVRDMLIESAASFSQAVFATNLYDQLGSRLRLLYDAAANSTLVRHEIWKCDGRWSFTPMARSRRPDWAAEWVWQPIPNCTQPTSPTHPTLQSSPSFSRSSWL